MFEYSSNKFKSIDVNDIDLIEDKINLIDIREFHEFRSGHIKGAKNIPYGELIEYKEEYLDKNKEYFIVCKAGSRSFRACKELRQEGYKVLDVEGGIIAYEGELVY